MAELYNAKEFATLCGVTQQTVCNWINTNKIKPISTLGRSSGFSMQQVVSYYKSKIQSNNSAKGLCVIIGTKEYTDKVEKSVTKQLSTKKLISIPFDYDTVSSLDSYIESKVLSNNNTETTNMSENQQQVLVEFIKDFKNMVNQTIMHLYTTNQHIRKIAYEELLDIALGTMDNSKIPIYNAKINNDTEVMFSTLNELFYLKYLELANNYGVGNACSRVDLRESVFNVELDSIVNTLTDYPMLIEECNKKAWNICKKNQDKVTTTVLSDYLKQIYENGFFTTIHINNETDLSSIRPFITNSLLLNRDYNELIVYQMKDLDWDLSRFNEYLQDIPKNTNTIADMINSKTF